ncbi:hypothetical protein SAMN05216480_10268 [Pustulibacterium marinum]|uniref:Peptidoglycan-binding protein LysM n=1 Tax=Pustulibacterium marinum TaxID=1224947 RepID=A0A1I7FNP5_9FLAO|nr:peptidoglycan-binding protein LysM [Pustulibacterium marinum]SFU37775.1 hypothetical protein SAMN05216480_10268 [Pustulibacterium marinum]
MRNGIVKITFFLLAVVFICVGYVAKDKIMLRKKEEKVAIVFEQPDSLSMTKAMFPKITTSQPVIKNKITPPFIGKSFTGFKEALGYKESRGNYFIVNQLGYLGKYQFGANTLSAFGIRDTQKFLNSPELQEKVFLAYMSRNKAILKNEIAKYTGKTIGGVLVTESGLLAAAHLGGAGNVKRYLRTNGATRFKDANGASVRFYMKKFSGYDVSFIKSDRYAKI